MLNKIRYSHIKAIRRGIFLYRNADRRKRLFLVLIASIFIFTASLPVTTLSGADTEIVLSGEKIEQSDPAVADFDGDGDLEIVVGGVDGMLYVLSYNGSTWSVVWSRQTADDLNAAGAPSSCANTQKSDIRSAPAIADLDGDGKLEIVVTIGGDAGKHYNGGVLVYHYNSAWDFSVVPGWPQPKLDIVGGGAGASNPDGCWDGIWGSPALGDVDKDGKMEIAVEGFDRRIHLWHSDGTYVSGWPIDGTNDGIHRGGWSSPALADIDGNDNGRLEIIVGSDDFPNGGQPPYYFYVFNDDSSILFRKETSKNTVSSPAVGDIDGNGKLDIVVGTGGYSGDGHKVYAWDNQGNDLPGWPKATGGDMPASPALGDIDGDGKLDVVIGCGKEGDPSPAPCKELYAFHGDGSNVAGFPTIPENNTGFSWDPNGLPYTPILADYDGDGSIEILVLNRWSFGLSTVEKNGQSNNNPAFVSQSTLGSAPAVADVDNDGKLEIVIGGMNASGHGTVYIWDVAGGVNDARPWPMFHGNVARTGLIEQPPDLENMGDVLFFHQSGSGGGATYTRTVTLRNNGGGSFDWGATHSIANLQVTPTSGTFLENQSFEIVYTISPSGSGLLSGWNNLGNVTITATNNGDPISGSPQVIPIRVFVGDVNQIFLPLVFK